MNPSDGTSGMNPNRPGRETVDYFRRIEHLCRKNVFAEAEAAEVIDDLAEDRPAHQDKVICDVLCSRVLEQVLARAGPARIDRFFSLFKSRYATLACDKYASHVLEFILTECKKSASTLSADALQYFLLEITHSDDTISTLARDKFGSHVLRSAMPLICEDENIRRRLLLVLFEDFVQLAADPAASFVLQAFVDSAALEKIPKVLDVEHFRRLSCDKTASFLIQKMAERINTRAWIKLLSSTFTESFVSDRYGHFVVEAVLRSMAASFLDEQIVAMIDSIASFRAPALSTVVQEVAKLCQKRELQAHFCSKLGNARAASDSFLEELMFKRFAPEFHPRSIDSALDALCSNLGSRRFEGFISNPLVPFVAKQKLIAEAVRGKVAQLARDKFGSRALERAFAEAEKSKRNTILRELNESRNDLEGHPIGKHILRTCSEEHQQKTGVKRELEEFLLQAEGSKGAGDGVSMPSVQDLLTKSKNKKPTKKKNSSSNKNDDDDRV